MTSLKRHCADQQRPPGKLEGREESPSNTSIGTGYVFESFCPASLFDLTHNGSSLDQGGPGPGTAKSHTVLSCSSLLGGCRMVLV